MRFGPFVFLVLAFGALFGWFAPDLSRPGLAAAADPPAVERDEAAAPRPLRRDGEVELKRADDGHFYAEVEVSSGSARMLVDTGATVVALTGDDAAMLGVRWDQSEVRPVARGASGEVHGVRVVLDRIRIGDLEAREVEAIVVPEGLRTSLLGQSFLSRLRRMEMNGDTMVLGG